MNLYYILKNRLEFDFIKKKLDNKFQICVFIIILMKGKNN